MAAVADVIVTIAIRTTVYAVADSTDLPIFVTQVAVDTAAIKREKAGGKDPAGAGKDSAAKIAANAVKRGKALGDYEALGDRTDVGANIDAHKRDTIPIMATDNEVKGLIGSPIKSKYNLRNYIVQKFLSYTFFLKILYKCF